MVYELAEAADERQLSRLVARYGGLGLLGLDELNDIHLDPRGAELLFQILTERAERASVAVASIAPFSEWGQPSMTPGSPSSSLTGSPSAPTSSRPAPTPTGSDSPSRPKEVLPRPESIRKVGPVTMIKPGPNQIIIPNMDINDFKPRILEHRERQQHLEATESEARAPLGQRRCRRAIDGRTTRHQGNRQSQGQLGEEAFGCVTTVDASGKPRHLGRARNRLWLELTSAAWPTSRRPPHSRTTGEWPPTFQPTPTNSPAHLTDSVAGPSNPYPIAKHSSDRLSQPIGQQPARTLSESGTSMPSAETCELAASTSSSAEQANRCRSASQECPGLDIQPEPQLEGSRFCPVWWA